MGKEASVHAALWQIGRISSFHFPSTPLDFRMSPRTVVDELSVLLDLEILLPMMYFGPGSWVTARQNLVTQICHIGLKRSGLDKGRVGFLLFQPYFFGEKCTQITFKLKFVSKVDACSNWLYVYVVINYWNSDSTVYCSKISAIQYS